MCNFYMMYRYDPRQGLSTDACSMVEMRDDLYPGYTDEPLPPEPEMNMKRSAEGTYSVVCNFYSTSVTLAYLIPVLLA